MFKLILWLCEIFNNSQIQLHTQGNFILEISLISSLDDRGIIISLFTKFLEIANIFLPKGNAYYYHRADAQFSNFISAKEIATFHGLQESWVGIHGGETREPGPWNQHPVFNHTNNTFTFPFYKDEKCSLPRDGQHIFPFIEIYVSIWEQARNISKKTKYT